MEAAVSIPLLALLIMTAVTIFFWAVRMYLVQLADVELEQEVQMVFQRLMDEAQESEGIDKHPDGRGYVFVKKKDPLDQTARSKTYGRNYKLHTMEGVDKLVAEDNDAPLTGDHALAMVTITVFDIEEDEERPGIYRLQLTGESLVTQHEYSLSSAVYLPAAARESGHKNQ